MNAATFPQAAIVEALFRALLRATDEAVTARSLADAVAPRFSAVPMPLIRAPARALLALAFDPAAITVEAVETVADSRQDAAEALDWLAGALRSEADAMREDAGLLRIVQ